MKKTAERPRPSPLQEPIVVVWIEDTEEEPGVLSFAGHLTGLRARLAKELLDENPDQETEARLWGDRPREQRREVAAP